MKESRSSVKKNKQKKVGNYLKKFAKLAVVVKHTRRAISSKSSCIVPLSSVFVGGSEAGLSRGKGDSYYAGPLLLLEEKIISVFSPHQLKARLKNYRGPLFPRRLLKFVNNLASGVYSSRGYGSRGSSETFLPVIRSLIPDWSAAKYRQTKINLFSAKEGRRKFSRVKRFCKRLDAKKNGFSPDTVETALVSAS